MARIAPTPRQEFAPVSAPVPDTTAATSQSIDDGSGVSSSQSVPLLLDALTARIEAVDPRRFSKTPVTGTPQSHGEHRRTTVIEKYPMWLMTMDMLMSLKTLEPHQDLLARKCLVRYRPGEHEGRVVFVSHQWAGHTHPDPTNEQLHCLQRLFQRMMSGEIEKIETDWKHRYFFRSNPFVTKREMMSAAPHMLIWLDFTSMPQPAVEVARRDALAAATAAAATAVPPPDGAHPEARVAAIATEEKTAPGAAVPGRTFSSSDHRSTLLESSELAVQLDLATESIPAYVEKSSLMIILTPPCKHHDRPGEIVSYQSWRGRGWCRLELAAATLSRKKIYPMVIQGPEAQPAFISSLDGLYLAPGLGQFTCCARNHKVGRGVCDKVKIGAVIDSMIQARASYLFSQPKRRFDARFFACAAPWFQRGLEGVIKTARSLRGRFDSDEGVPFIGQIVRAFTHKGVPFSEEAVVPIEDDGDNAQEALETTLRWRGDDKEASFCRKTGTSLLFWAVLNDNLPAVTAVQGAFAKAEDLNAELSKTLRFRYPQLGLQSKMSLLHTAMAFASWAVVENLIKNGVGVDLRAGDKGVPSRYPRGFDAAMFAAFFGRHDNIRRWSNQFPDWDWERRENGTGHTAIHCAALFGGGMPQETVKALVDVGASVESVQYHGVTLLHTAALNPDSTPELINYLCALPAFRASGGINAQVRPQTCSWAVIYWIARIATRLGSSHVVFNLMRDGLRSVPLQSAARSGHIDTFRVLLANGADPSIRNAIGTPPTGTLRAFFNETAFKQAVKTRSHSRRDTIRRQGKLPDVVKAMVMETRDGDP